EVDECRSIQRTGRRISTFGVVLARSGVNATRLVRADKNLRVARIRDSRVSSSAFTLLPDVASSQMSKELEAKVPECFGCVTESQVTISRSDVCYYRDSSETNKQSRVKRDGCLLTSSFTLANLGGKQNLPVITTMPTKVAVAFVAEGPVSRSLEVYASETTSSLSSHNVQGFVAGISVAYAIISEKQRALRAAVDCASEEGSAM